MIRPLVAIAIGALVVLAVVAEAASTKYEDDYKGDSYGKSTRSYGEDSYKHEPEYYKEEYHDPTYEKYNDHYGYGVDSYGKSYSTYSSDEPCPYRHKRSVNFDEL